MEGFRGTRQNCHHFSITCTRACLTWPQGAANQECALRKTGQFRVTLNWTPDDVCAGDTIDKLSTSKQFILFLARWGCIHNKVIDTIYAYIFLSQLLASQLARLLYLVMPSWHFEGFVRWRSDGTETCTHIEIILRDRHLFGALVLKSWPGRSDSFTSSRNPIETLG